MYRWCFETFSMSHIFVEVVGIDSSRWWFQTLSCLHNFWKMIYPLNVHICHTDCGTTNHHQPERDWFFMTFWDQSDHRLPNSALNLEKGLVPDPSHIQPLVEVGPLWNSHPASPWTFIKACLNSSACRSRQRSNPTSKWRLAQAGWSRARFLDEHFGYPLGVRRQLGHCKGGKCRSAPPTEICRVASGKTCPLAPTVPVRAGVKVEEPRGLIFTTWISWR